MDLLTLSFLLWAQQGIRGIRGNNYATLRTVPSAGSRHPFECYPLILHVEGLEPGLYHYLPMEHRLLLRSWRIRKKLLSMGRSPKFFGSSRLFSVMGAFTRGGWGFFKV